MSSWKYASALLLAASMMMAAQSPQTEKYTWKNVQIVGGGFVPGVIFHPTAPHVRYLRTDMGGAYRWDEGERRWQPILDWVPYKDLNLMGVESIALDAQDPARVYMACGTYTNKKTENGAILRSSDSGKTWQRTDVPFKFGGNEEGRGNGERLAVDPIDGRILFLATRKAGLWRSEDRGVSWQPVASFPDVSEPDPEIPVLQPGETEEHFWSRWPVFGAGIVFVKFQPAAGESGATKNIYVGVSRMGKPNLYVSHDAGKSWSPVRDAPVSYRPTRAALASDGTMYIAYGTAPGPGHMKNGAVWKLDTGNGRWMEITPEKPGDGKEFGYAAVSVDAHHPQWVIASTFHRPGQEGGEEIFRSTNGGASWTTIFGHGGQYDYRGAPYVAKTPIHWLFDIEIDPLDSDHALFTTGYGGWESFDLTAADHGKPTHWSVLTPGVEETVGLELNSPAAGAPLLSAIGDYGGFVHWDLDKPDPVGASAPPRMGTTFGITSAALQPQVMVRVGYSAENKPGEGISFSRDGGRSWNRTPSTPAPRSQAGSIAVSADGATWIWTPHREMPFVTHDAGAHWTAVQGLARGTRVLADPVDSTIFYAFSLAEGKIFRSTDAGASFPAQAIELPGESYRADPDPNGDMSARGDDRGGQDRLYATPGRTGDLWVAAFDGLYHLHAASGGEKLLFTRQPHVEEMHAFGFGKAAPGRSDPALYMIGTVDGQYGVFRSTDFAQSWVRINDDQHQWGLTLQITGDPKQYGRVYIGAHGRGILYGDPAR